MTSYIFCVNGISSIHISKLHILILSDGFVSQDRVQALKDASQIIDEGMKNVQRNCYFFIGICIAIVLLLLLTVNLEFPWGTQSIMAALRICLTIALGYCFWIAVVESRKEVVSMLGAKKGMQVAIESLEKGLNVDGF